jgi:putative FmdB family regulatory protein
MPTYEYECQACHERVEAVQKFSDPSLSVCPLCGGELRKVFSSVGIVFKGSGFYKNDSRSTKSTASETSSTKSDTSAATTPAAPAATPAATSSAASTSSSTD